jgi:ABC-type multidrug transport system permease subunit
MGTAMAMSLSGGFVLGLYLGWRRGTRRERFALILAILAVMLTALTVAREWERGSMEQLFATPVRRLEVILGKLLPYVAIGMVQVLLVVTVGAWLFDVPRSMPMIFSFAIGRILLCSCLLRHLHERRAKRRRPRSTSPLSATDRFRPTAW